MRNKHYILLLFIFLLSSVNVLAQQKATPKAGDGISNFLLRYNRSPKKYYDDFVKLNKGKLGKGDVLKMGVIYTIPPAKKSNVSSTRNTTQSSTDTKKKNKITKKDNSSSNESSEKQKKGTTTHEPLFGKRHSKVKVSSKRLAGACFYVVSGHGGPDPGAIGQVGKHELHEDEYAYDIALRLAKYLMEEGAEVRIIIQDSVDGIREDAYLSNSKRETCMGDPIPLNQVDRLQQRCDKINTLYRKDRKKYSYCRAIFIHVDSRSKGKQTDVFFYHSGMKAESKRLANNMKDMFESKYDKHQPNRGFTGTMSARNLYVLAHSSPSAVFVELGNIQNTFDQKRLVMSSNRDALGKWLMEGFLKDFKERK